MTAATAPYLANDRPARYPRSQVPGEFEDTERLHVRAPDTSASTDCVNDMVRRTGCSTFEATRTLEGKDLEKQQEIARTGDVDSDAVLAARLESALNELRAAGIDPTAQCMGGSTWGDVVARAVYQGRRSSVGGMIAREMKAKGAA